jgi:hypothetical protein
VYEINKKKTHRTAFILVDAYKSASRATADECFFPAVARLRRFVVVDSNSTSVEKGYRGSFLRKAVCEAVDTAHMSKPHPGTSPTSIGETVLVWATLFPPLF